MVSRGADPWGHSLARLIEEYPRDTRKEALRELLDLAKTLDKLYIPTRYPNGLPDLAPSEAYTRGEADVAIEGADRFLRLVRRLSGLDV